MKKTNTIALLIIMMSLPALITFVVSPESAEFMPELGESELESNYDWKNSKSEKEIIVVNPDTMEKKEIGFEKYIVGVVAAEMPASFEKEALKAQAVAARTYAYRRIQDNSENLDSMTDDVVNSIYQAYLTDDELKQKWGENFSEYYLKISEAVSETSGEIMIYDEIPIEAVFHSTSAGMTEYAGNVWQTDYPYLASVESKGDTYSPEYISEKTFNERELIKLLKENFSGLNLANHGFIKQFQIISKSGAGYVEEVQLGSKTLTGRQIREALGLKSTAFSVRQNNGDIIFTTKGYGHGVGMSQYGANQMAEAGLNYRDILCHYYTGVSFGTADYI